METTDPRNKMFALLDKMEVQDVYMKYDFEGCVIKYCWNPKIAYVKYKGDTPYQASQTSKLVVDCLLALNEITKKEYEAF